MKRYILIAMVSLLGLAACKEQHGTIFSNDVTGVYFEPINQSYRQERNFANYRTGDVEKDSMTLNITLTITTLGHLDATRDRVAIMRTKPLLNEDTGEDYELADLTFDERIIIPAGSHQVKTLITLNLPEIHTQTGAILYFDSTDPMSDFGEGIDGSSEFIIRSDYSYVEPEEWKDVKQYYGEYSQDKHIFLLKLLGNGFYSSSATTGQLVNYNYQAVVAARQEARIAYERGSTSRYVPDIPFVVRAYSAYSNEKSYGKPWYWESLRDSDRNPIDVVKYYGDWFPDEEEDDHYDRSFAMLAQYAGLNTQNEREFFSDKVRAHKMVIKCMMDTYNSYFKYPTIHYMPTYDDLGVGVFNYTINGKYRCAGLLEEIDYSDPEFEVVPAYWEDEAGKLVEPYYGKYSWAKVAFIIKNLLPEYPRTSYFPRMFCVSSCYKGFDYNTYYETSYTKWPEARQDNNSEDKDNKEDGSNVGFHSEQAQLEEYSKFLHDKAIAAGFTDWPDPDHLPVIK